MNSNDIPTGSTPSLETLMKFNGMNLSDYCFLKITLGDNRGWDAKRVLKTDCAKAGIRILPSQYGKEVTSWTVYNSVKSS